MSGLKYVSLEMQRLGSKYTVLYDFFLLLRIGRSRTYKQLFVYTRSKIVYSSIPTR